MIALLLWRKKFHLLLLSSPSSLDGDVESGLWCCCCQLALCHTHPLPLFHWADSSGRQSRSGVAEYQCRGIMHILQVKEFQNTQGLPAIPWNTKRKKKKIPWAAHVFHLASAFLHLKITSDTQQTLWTERSPEFTVKQSPRSPQPTSGPVKRCNF